MKIILLIAGLLVTVQAEQKLNRDLLPNNLKNVEDQISTLVNRISSVNGTLKSCDLSVPTTEKTDNIQNHGNNNTNNYINKFYESVRNYHFLILQKLFLMFTKINVFLLYANKDQTFNTTVYPSKLYPFLSTTGENNAMHILFELEIVKSVLDKIGDTCSDIFEKQIENSDKDGFFVAKQFIDKIYNLTERLEKDPTAFRYYLW